MRISTQSFFEQNLTAMNSQQQKLFQVQQQISAGTKLLTSADDPLAVARALGVSDSIAKTAQYASNRGSVLQSLSMEEGALQSATSTLQDIKTLTVQASSGTLSDADRAALATSLQSHLDQLVAVANSDNGNGQFLFAGYKSANPPFAQQAGGSVQYVGDQGQLLKQVDISRQMAATDDGRSVFQSVQAGAGYVSASSIGNTGSGVFGPTAVVNAADANYGKDFVISFTSPPLSYQVLSNGAALVPAVNGTYTAGGPIRFGGLQINISGAPAAGDTFKIATAKNAGTDVFEAISDLVNALRKPLTGGGAAAQAQLSNALNTASSKITNAQDNVLTIRASVGSRMLELDALNTSGASRDLIDKSYLSELQDLDYSKAISEFSQRETSLKATLQTFAKLNSIALFNYL